ncbi:hypothetical protein ACSBR1_026094 [Camellia fascicularis]
MGNLLVAIAKNGNQGLFFVAFAIVDSENVANWEWFLRQLLEVVDRDRMLTFVLDRHVSLLQAMPHVFPLAYRVFCLLHLQMNLRDRMKYVKAEKKIGLMRKLCECAYAPTVTSFNQKIEALKLYSPAVVGEFLKDLHPGHWANAYFRLCLMRDCGVYVGVIDTVRCVQTLPSHSTIGFKKPVIFLLCKWAT